MTICSGEVKNSTEECVADFCLTMIYACRCIWSRCTREYGVMCDVYGMWCMQEYALSECEDVLPSV